MNFNPAVVRQQIENLRVAHPDLVEDDETWMLAIESETDLDAVLTKIVRKIEDTKALEVGTKDRLDELRARKDRFGRKVDSLRGLAFKMMEAAGVDAMVLPEATISIRKGLPHLVGEADAASLPDELCKISRDVDRTKVKEAIKQGRDVPGFSLSNSSPSLTIRVK